MSHTVTIRTQTLTTNASAIIINTAYVKTLNGLLKLAQLILGCISAIVLTTQHQGWFYYRSSGIFFLLMTTTFIIGTFILFLSYLLSLSSYPVITKTNYEFMYHVVAFTLLLVAAITFAIEVNRYYSRSDWLIIVMVLSFINCVLYLVSAVFGYRSYRGL